MANLNCNHRFGPLSQDNSGGVRRKAKVCRYCGLLMVCVIGWKGDGIKSEPVINQFLMDADGNRYPMSSWKGYNHKFIPGSNPYFRMRKDENAETVDNTMRNDANADQK